MDLTHAPSPCYVIDMGKLKANLEILKRVQEESGCKILLALKGFATFSTFPLIRKYLVGVTASSVSEAMLGYHEFKRDVHVYAPAYSQSDIDQILPIANHITFNSFSQYHRYKKQIQNPEYNPETAIRINPEYSEIEVALYDPCAPNSRLGTTLKEFEKNDLSGISGLHFHTMCEQNADTLVNTLNIVEEKFGKYFEDIKWINFGGGHHISRPDYDVNLLINILKDFKMRHNLEIFLEPGEAIALNTGVLVAEVLDIVNNGMQIAILDTSATAHMPDVLEMPYRAEIIGAGKPGEKEHTIRLGGLTCLAGDIIGDYSFDKPLKIGDRLVFEDMAHYTMVKNNTFNGVNLPSIALWHPENEELEVVRSFTYEDYRNRLS